MLSNTNNLFILNPLTAIFLSGVATRLIVILFFNNSNSVLDKSSHIYSNSIKRIERWQQIFNDYCSEYYEEYSEVYEKEEFDSSIELNPFIIHTNLLIRYSMIIIDSTRLKKNSKKTKNNVKKWFLLMSFIKDSKLWQVHMTKQNLNKIHDLENEYSILFNNGTESERGNEFIEFNPVALFIRSAFIVNIHKTRFNTLLFNFWEKSNVLVFTKYLPLDQYLTEISWDKKLLNFSPEFPLINHLPCMDIFKMWDGSAQKSSPIPIYEIFAFILQVINGNMVTIHYHQRNQFNLPCINEISNLCIFQKFSSHAKLTMKDNMKNIVENEKQRRFHLNEKNKRNHVRVNNNIVDKNLCMPLGFSFMFQIYLKKQFETRIGDRCDDKGDIVHGVVVSARGMYQTKKLIHANEKETSNQLCKKIFCRRSKRIILKRVDYTEQQNVDAEEEEDQFSDMVIVTNSKCNKMNEVLNTQEHDDHNIEEPKSSEKLFLRISQRNRILENYVDKNMDTIQRLFDEDIPLHQELKSIKNSYGRMGRRSNLDDTVKINQFFKNDTSISSDLTDQQISKIKSTKHTSLLFLGKSIISSNKKRRTTFCKKNSKK